MITRLPHAAWLLPLALLATPALAQPEPIKYGKVDAAQFDPKQYPTAADAPAIVLCDYGTSRIVGGEDDFQVLFERVKRVLVLNKAGYEQATVQIPLYHKEGRQERITNLRGCTYNLNGKAVEKLPLDAKAIFTEKQDEHHDVRKFTLPDVTVGSIIEYAYTIRSDFYFNLPDWQFQQDIPVEWSEYRAVMPSFFQYKQIPHGFLPYAVKDVSVVPYHTSYRASVEDNYGKHIGAADHVSQISTQALSCRWAMQHVPAFREEPYMTTANDYLAGIDFELDLIQFDPKSPHPVTSTWEKITQEMLKDEQFGAWISGRTPLTAQAEALATAVPDVAARAAAVRELVLRAVRYNGEARLYTQQPMRRVLEQQRGNAAEVNLLLLRTLHDAGLPDAAPVLVSTRSHGRVQTEIPLLSQFNYVVAGLPLPSGQTLLLDATEPTAPAGTLPVRCLNGQGRLLATQGRWLPLAPQQKHLQLTNAQLSLDDKGQLSGKLHREYSGYAALTERNELAEQGEKTYLTAQQRQLGELQLQSPKLSQTETLDKALVLDGQLTMPAPEAAERLYLPLLQFFTERQNPFTNDRRIYPVDFGTVREHITTLTLALPKGYAVEELPKNTVLDLPNNGGRYSCELTLRDNVLYCNSRLQLRKTEFMPVEYAGLRELFTRALAKQAEPVVLRRVAN